MGITLTLLSWDDSRIMPPTQSRANHFIDSKVSLRWAVRLPIWQHYKWIRIVVLPYMLVSSIRILVAQIRSHWGHCFLVFQAEPSMMVPNKNIRRILVLRTEVQWAPPSGCRDTRESAGPHSPSRCKKLNCFTSALLGFAASSLAGAAKRCATVITMALRTPQTRWRFSSLGKSSNHWTDNMEPLKIINHQKTINSH